ncbi:MAG TPA: tetratricopeptide repeat protein [Polyangia bacterium]|nr:tetratricopeptide repeat protein [Polyangia bacterium]
MKPELQSALQLLETEPNNPDALAALAAAAEGGGNGHSDPAAERAFRESRRVHVERGDHELVVRLIDLELGWQKDPGRRAELLVEKGRILSEEFWREGEAELCYQRALEARPGDERAMAALAESAAARADGAKHAEEYAAKVAQAAQADGAAEKALLANLLVSLAEVQAKFQPNADGEVESLLRRALEADPRHKKAALQLERWLKRAERWEELGALLAKRAEAAPSKEEKVAGLLALAEFQRERLGRPDLAAETIKKALVTDPLHARAMKALGELYAAEENWQALQKLYENALRARPRSDVELALQVQLGTLLWQKVGQFEAAEEQFRKVRQRAPGHPAMLDFYREFFQRRNEGQKLLQVLLGAQKIEPDEKKRLQLSVEMAVIAEGPGGSLEKAIDLWKSIFKVDKTHPEAGAALRRLYRKTEKWNALLELLKEEIEALGKNPAAIDERIERLLDVVAIYRDKLNLDVMVLNTYNTILQLKPDHEGALAALAAKYEAMGRWNDLITVLQRQADHHADRQADPMERARLLRRVAMLWVEKFGNHNQAVKPLEELYALLPGDADVVVRLRDIYTKRRAWRALLDLERREIERLEGPIRRAKLVEMARMAAERLGDASEAMSIWNRVLEDNPQDAEALASLALLYERERRYPALAEVLGRQRLGLTEPKVAVPLLEKLAALWGERLGVPRKAIEAYQDILRIAPGHHRTMRQLRELLVQAGDTDQLEVLYAQTKQWDELCETLMTVAERTTDLAQRVKLNRRVAEVALEQLHQPERAGKAYERILAVEPQNLDAARALVPIYRRGEKWARLLATYEILLGHAQGNAERLELHREIRLLCEEKLGSKQLAFSWCAKAFAIDGDDPELERELERLAREADAFDLLMEIYARQSRELPEGPRKVLRLRQVADLLLTRLNRADEARRYYVEVLERVPGDLQALGALEQLYAQGSSWNELLTIYRQRLESTTERERRIELLFKIARIEEEKGARIEEALETYRNVLDEEPTSTRALRALERLYEVSRNWRGLAEVVERQLSLVTNDAEMEVALSYQLGELYANKLGESETALPLYRRAFARQPLHRPTLTALERYLAEGNPARVEVARLLVPIYEKIDELGRLVEALSILLGAAAGQDRDEELALLRRLMVLVGRRLGDVEKSFGYAVRLFELVPADLGVRHELREMADLLSNHRDLARHLRAAEERLATIEAAGAPSTLVRDLAWEQARLYEEKLRDGKSAEEAYLRVLTYDDRYEGALLALERMYRTGARHRELRDLLMKRKEYAAEPQMVATRRDLLFQICELEEGPLGDVAAATEHYLEVLELEASSPRAFKALERIYTTGERWRDLDELLGRLVDFTDKAEDRAQLKTRRAELHALRLDDPEGACDLYEEAIGEDAKNEGARKGLEKLMARPDLRLRIARMLEPFYQADEAWPKFISVLQVQRDHAEGADVVVLLGRIARIVEEKLGSRQQAFTVWREALLIDPSEEVPRVQLERLALILGKYAEMADAWLEAESRVEPHDLSLRADFLRRAAVIYDEDLEDPKKALGVYRRLLDLDPTNLETARPAAQALERLYVGQKAWPELIDILRREAEWAEAAEAKKDYLRRVGEVQEELLRTPDAAIATHREILDLDAEDRDALDALERLHGLEGQWPELIGILQRRVALSNDARERRELRWRIARLTEEKLGASVGSDEIIAAYAAVLDEHPEDVPALETLARLYEAAERPVDLLETLERRLVLENKKAGRVALLGRIAALLEGPLHRLEEALERYREVLADEPGNEAARQGIERMLADPDLRLRAAAVLEPFYETRGERAKLIGLHELWAEHAPELQERLQRLRRIAALQQQAGDLGASFQALARAARLAVAELELPVLLDSLERLSVKGGLRAELVGLYRDLGADILDAEIKESVYLTVATESRVLGDRATAREYFRRVLDAAPDHPRALDALEELYAEAKEYEPLLEIYNRRAELSGSDDDRRYQYVTFSARLCRHELGRPEEAISYYEQILQLYPADEEATQALDELYTDAGRNADLADLLERRLGFTEDVEHAVLLHFRLGGLYGGELGDNQRALEHYRSALDGDADHPGAIAALERLLDDPVLRVEAAELLEPVYAARHDWPALIRIYEVRLEAADDTQQRLWLTRRIARAYEEQLEDLEASFRWYGKVFREDPSDRQIRDQLWRLAGILDCFKDLATIYDEYLADVYEETPASLEVLRAVAQIYDLRLGDVDRAKGAYLRLLRHEAADAAAFQGLESMLTRARRWTDLLEIYRDAAEGSLELPRRKELLFKICQVYEHALQDRDAAIDAYRAVLELDEEDTRAIAALDRLYVTSKRWHDLVELLTRQFERVPKEEGDKRRIQLKLRLGGLFEKELADLPSAIDAYEEVIGFDQNNKEAISALERLILDHDQRFRIAQILEPIYQLQDQWAKLVVIYDAELEFIDDKQRRVELLKEIARIHAQRGGDLQLAFDALARAWTEEVGEGEENEGPLYRSLLEAAKPIGAWKQLIRVLEQAVEGSYDSDLVARVHARVAEVHEQKRGDAAAAVESWRKVVHVSEDHEAGWKALERLLAQLARHKELVEVLEKRAQLSLDLAEQKSLYYRAAELYERVLNQGEQAISTWRHVLTLDEDDAPALSALARLFRERKAWRELTEIYARQIELAMAERDRRPLRFAMAQVFEEHLGEAFEAIAAYRGALEADARDLDAHEALARLYEKEAAWPDLLETLDAIAPLKPPGAERDAVRVRAAKVLEERQNEPEEAIERYRQILDDSPGNEAARKALEVLVQREELREAAARVLEPLYRARGEHRPLVELYELKLQLESDPAERRTLLAGMAEIYETGLGDAAGAFRAWGRVLAEDPRDEAVHGELERLASQHKLWAELARLYEERFEAVLDGDVQRQLALKLADLYETRLGDDERAVARYRKALELPGEEFGPLAALDRLLVRTGKHLDLAEILEREAQAATESEAQAQFLYRLGELRQATLNDRDGALSAYRDALDREPGHAGARQALEQLLGSPEQAGGALDVLERLYETDGDHKKRVELAEVRLKLISDRPGRASQLQQISRLWEEELSDRRQALAAMIRALKEQPEDTSLLDEVERLAAPDELALAADTFHEVIEQGVPSNAARELGLRAARLYDRLGDPGNAEGHYISVLDVDQENAEALEALERIYRRQGELEALADILGRRADVENDIVAKKRMYAEVARLRENALQDRAGAIDAWNKVLDADEADGPALAALSALYEAAQSWGELVEVLEHWSRFAATNQDQVSLKTRTAALYAEKLGKPDKALDAYRDLLDLAPNSVLAMTKLEELYERKGDWSSLQETLTRRLGAVPPGREQVPIYRRLARVAVEHLDAAEDAVGFYQQILEELPEDLETLQGLEGLLAKLEKWYDLVDTLKQHAALCAKKGDKPGEIAQLARAAEVLEGKLENAEAAAELLEKVLAREPNNVRALMTLAKLYEAQHDNDKCMETLQKAVKLAAGGSERAELEFRLGKIEAERSGEAAAEPFFRRALESDPYHAGAAERLERTAREQGDWMQVAALLERRVEQAADKERKPLLIELSQILSSRVGDAEGALAALEQAHALAPDDMAILEPLADAYFHAGRLEQALPLYKGLIDKLSKGRRSKELGRLNFRLGAIAEKQGDRALALQQYQAAYQIDASHAPTLAALGRIWTEAGEWEKARRIYRSMLLQNLDPSSGVTKADVYLQLGIIHEKVNETPKAVGMYERGLEIDPNHAELKASLQRVRGAKTK